MLRRRKEMIKKMMIMETMVIVTVMMTMADDDDEIDSVQHVRGQVRHGLGVERKTKECGEV